MAESREKILAGIENIEIIIQEVEELTKKDELNKYEINSAALFLHNFYNGVENILVQILKNHNFMIPKTANWHKDLLILALNEKFLTEDLHQELLKYLSFRHFIAHNYTFKIDYDLFSPLFRNLLKVYIKFKEKIISEIERLQ